jgi:hypothetical protein
MAGNIGPILLGLGAAFLLMRKKDEGGYGHSDGGPAFGGTDPGGSSACHLLDGIWAPSTSPADSALNAIDPETGAPYTQKDNLKVLPFTLEGFVAARTLLLEQYNMSPRPEDDVVIFMTEKNLTAHISGGCPWASPKSWTPRMQHIHDAIAVLYDEIKKHNA